MSKDTRDWPEIDITEPDAIDELKDEEKDKMAAGTDLRNIDAQLDAALPDLDGEEKDHKAWIPGLILIGIGSYFLLTNFTDLRLDNWWALFILIPALGSLGKAASDWRSHGRLTGEGRGALIGGLILSLVAAAFLFSLDWGLIWPFFLIFGGLGALLGAFSSD